MNQDKVLKRVIAYKTRNLFYFKADIIRSLSTFAMTNNSYRSFYEAIFFKLADI